jgi:hypothetical protein
MKGNTKARNAKEYIASLTEPRKSEILALDRLIRKEAPSLTRQFYYGMLSYGAFHYKYASGREGDWFVLALASQKNYISLYVCMADRGKYVAENYKKLLPKADIGKSCVRFKKLDDLDLKVVAQMIGDSLTALKKNKIRLLK